MSKSEIPQDLTQIMLRDYVCATCWGHLVERHDKERGWFVECGQFGAEHAGFVTRYYADRRREESYGELIEVRDMMQVIGILSNPNAGKSTKQLLNELGF